MRVLSSSPEETARAGFRLGRLLRAGQTVCLYGELGAGKTTLVKGIGAALGVPERDIHSASFTIVADYGTEPPLYHIDLYRIERPEDLDDVGLYDYVGGDGIAVVEWAERMEAPEECIRVSIKFLADETREIIIEGIDEEGWNTV